MKTGLRLVLPMALVCALGACAKKGADPGRPAAEAPRGDALFLAEAPALVPDDLEADFDAMGVKRIYVPGATMSASGAVAAVNPPPPNPIRRPVVFTVNADPGVLGLLGPEAKGELVGEAWASGLKKLVADARSWAQVAGVHLHVLPRPENAPALAAALKALRRGLELPVSVTLPSDAPAAAWKPLAGAADEALVLAFGRRPESGDQFAKPMSADAVRDFPLPFRMLVVAGGYGKGGAEGTGRRIPDGEIDRLSEDRGLDFDFSGLLTSDPGAIVRFKPRPGVAPARTLLAQDGGSAEFRYLTADDLRIFLEQLGRLATTNLKGRVFLVDGLPKDGHLIGFPALRALLTGKPLDPKLSVKIDSRAAGPNAVDLTFEVTNVGATPSELSRTNGFLDVHVKGGVVANAQPGDFDRFEILVPEGAGFRPAPFGRATIVKLYENIFVADEQNHAGPVRVAGAHPEVSVGYHFLLPGGRELRAEPERVEIAQPKPTAKPGRKR